MITLIILTIALFASWLLIPQKLSRYIIGSIVTFLFVVQIIGKYDTTFWYEKKRFTNRKNVFIQLRIQNQAQMLIAK